MEFAFASHFDKRKKADALVIPFWKGNVHPEPAADQTLQNPLLNVALKTGDFKGKEGEILYLYLDGQPEKRVILVGLGPQQKLTVETLRKCYGGVTKSCLGKRLKELNVVLPQSAHLSDELIAEGVCEGVLLPNYIFDRLKHQNPEEAEDGSLLQKITFIGLDKEVLEIAEEIFAVCDGVYYARDLINGNADEVTPQYLVQCARGLEKEYAKIKTTVFDKKHIEKEKMGLLLAVNRGSSLDPAFIIMEYRGNPKSKDHTVMVGKGITYDTGGLNLKPTGGMETMKCDMSGAAACFGALLAVCHLGLKVNFTIVVPSTENSIDANSFKPGDVYTSHAGKTVEMMNSDAEGRLILADALSYAVQKLNPTRLIDIATLTGAIEISLGSEASGLMSNDDKLAEALMQAGEKTYERLWRMPLYEEYKDKLKSDIADIKSWNGRSASSCVAATFLRYFVDDSIPWAHLDIAGTAYVTEAKKYLPKYATGVGVRLIVELLKGLSK
ncbi:leucyl aminopeptidase [Candidatus Protochlamydia phocaeensis]|uniref:leucyl aminopeptidase n=1 Tax=Candidatus Protochlamydia phocaeensis TaxID=1414722 RepID=UPI0008387F8F|nr:leucyl aminopeptidase [Candidatus Protochlamydia phocaeensis]